MRKSIISRIILHSLTVLFTPYLYILVCNVTLPIVNCSASSVSHDCTKAFSKSDGEYWHSENTEQLEWIRLDLDDDYFIKNLQVRQASNHKVNSITVVFSDYTEVRQKLEEVSNKWVDVHLPLDITSSYINITTMRENRTEARMAIGQVRVRGCHPGTYLTSVSQILYISYYDSIISLFYKTIIFK